MSLFGVSKADLTLHTSKNHYTNLQYKNDKKLAKKKKIYLIIRGRKHFDKPIYH